jgi:hypothetical protein
LRWVPQALDRELRVTQTITIGRANTYLASLDVALGAGSLWVTNYHAATLARVDPTSLDVNRDDQDRQPSVRHHRRCRPGLGHGELRPEDRAAWAGEEAGLQEERHDLRLADGLAVEALDCESLLRAALLDVLDERGQCDPQPILLRIS